MSSTSGLPPYNNRFRHSSGSCSNHASVTTAGPRLQSVSQGVTMFEYPPSLSQLVYGSLQGSSPQEQFTVHSDGHYHRMTSFEHPIPVSTDLTHKFSPGDVYEYISRPMHPGKPRRLSRQVSADTKRQVFAASRGPQANGKESAAAGQGVTSVDSGCDEVFVDVAAGEPLGSPQPHPLILPNTSLFRSKSTVEMTVSTSSTASILPNPYNRLNHRIHSAIWCCSCFYLLFFCCLPAIHYMEQSDVQYNRNNHKRARSLGRTASFMFFTGTIIALSVFALIFFLGIFFAVY